jgi:hypothetical protein
MLSLPISCMKFLFPKLLVTNFWPGLMARAEIWGHSKVSRKVRKRRHRNPLFSHIGDEISKNKGGKITLVALTGHETQFRSKFGAQLSLHCPFFSWTPSSNHCCCYVNCNYKCSGASLVHLMLSFSISYPYLTRGLSHCGLAIYIKRYLNAKEEWWKLKYFTMQKSNLQKIL